MKKFWNGFNKLEEGVNNFVLIVSTLVLFVNVLLRFFFSASTSWAEELTRYLIVWLTFVGGSICAKENSHVSIDLIHHLLPLKFQKVLLILCHLISAAFLVILGYFSWQMMSFNMVSGQVSPALLLPMWIAYISITLGSFLMAIRYMENVIKEAKNLVIKSSNSDEAIKLKKYEAENNLL